ncbi:MAG: alpha/beta hydrolase [Halioglobus sp.]
MTRRFASITLAAIATVIAGILFVVIPSQAIKAIHVPLTTSPTDVGLAYENFTLTPTDADLTLKGWWMAADDPVATMVFIHGGGSNRHSTYFESLAFYRAMVDVGVSVAAIDLRNHGMSGDDGNGLQFGRTEMHDALATIDWARTKAGDGPLFLMGISMGGATSIHAAHAGAKVDGVILLDPLLDTRDTFMRGGVAQTGLPAALFAPAAWSAMQFFGLPSGADEALAKAKTLDVPILLIQDPDDPVTRRPFAEDLARHNPQVTLWLPPPIDPQHPDLAWKGYWGSHVSAFIFYPEQTTTQITQFMEAAQSPL